MSGRYGACERAGQKDTGRSILVLQMKAGEETVQDLVEREDVDQIADRIAYPIPDRRNYRDEAHGYLPSGPSWDDIAPGYLTLD